MTDRDAFIAQLSSELEPVKPAPTGLMALLWLLLSGTWVVSMTHFTGHLRPGAAQQLLEHPHFFVESAVGLMAILLLGVIGFRSAIPGALPKPLLWLGLGLLVVWLGSYVVGLQVPALEPSMLGKRDHCMSETLMFGLPPALLALLMARRLYPLDGARTALLLSLSAGMMPALYMQLACMYDPSHILRLHILPGLLVALLGLAAALLLPALLRRQPSRSE